MGASAKLPNLAYRFVEHALYLDEFCAAVIPRNQQVILVVHDWGSALGLHWARRNAHRVAGLAFMEFVPPMPTWEILEKGGGASMFQAFRGPPEIGRKLIIEENVFVEKVLSGGVVRGLTEKEMEHYQAPFLEPSSREPLYRWPNEVPIRANPQMCTLLRKSIMRACWKMRSRSCSSGPLRGLLLGRNWLAGTERR